MLTDEQRNELKTLILEYGIAAVMESSESRPRQINRIINFVDNIAASAAPAECPTIMDNLRVEPPLVSNEYVADGCEKFAAPAEGREPFGWISKKDFESGSGVGLVGAKVHPDDVPLFTATTPTMSEEVRGDLQAEIDRLNAIINTPQADDFLRSVSIEAEHQRQRWPSECDAGKTPADWFWLVGYLGGKALHAHAAVNIEKAEHHVITTAAACANWHRAMFGKTNMRPGIDGDAIERIDRAAAKGGSDEQ